MFRKVIPSDTSSVRCQFDDAVFAILHGGKLVEMVSDLHHLLRKHRNEILKVTQCHSSHQIWSVIGSVRISVNISWQQCSRPAWNDCACLTTVGLKSYTELQ